MVATTLRLSFCGVPAPLTNPILRGGLQPKGVELSVKESAAVDNLSREMLDVAYDVAEMSLATYLQARVATGLPVIGLPIFTGRRFLQPGIATRRDTGITSPADFAGKRVAIPQFWQTSSVWHRGILLSEYGVRQESVTWHTARGERMEGLGFPPGVTVNHKPGDATIEDFLLAKEVDALMSPGSRADLVREHPDVVQPFDDVREAQCQYHRKTRVFPIMHFMVMKEELARQHPWLPEALCQAFQDAKEAAARDGLPGPIAGLSVDEARKLFGDDPWGYGLARNRHTVETFVSYSRNMGMIDRDVSVDELFAPSTLKLFE